MEITKKTLVVKVHKPNTKCFFSFGRFEIGGGKVLQ